MEFTYRGEPCTIVGADTVRREIAPTVDLTVGYGRSTVVYEADPNEVSILKYNVRSPAVVHQRFMDLQLMRPECAKLKKQLNAVEEELSTKDDEITELNSRIQDLENIFAEQRTAKKEGPDDPS